ncbi:MAG: TetR/AcrR family transcriptional regulator [Candidatus Cloacimonetes bacterium]|nr:TetR/AcrR family transcriptional regulator [Candidatus Cloacimonadota bacterium]
MNRKEKEMLRRKSDIIQAAHDLFLEKGYDDVTMEEIAQKAEFTRRTLYSYFNGKRDLVVEVLIEAVDGFEMEYRNAVAAAANSYQELAGLAATYFRFYDQTPMYYLLMQQFDLAVHNDWDKLSDTVKDDLRNMNFSMDALAEEIIRRGMGNGTFRADLIPELAATFFWKSLYGIVHQYILHAQFPNSYYFIEVRYMLRGLTIDPARYEE